jgi:hypothetical protein
MRRARKKLMIDLGMDVKGDFYHIKDKSPYIAKVKEVLELREMETRELAIQRENFDLYPTYSETRSILFRRIYLVKKDIKELKLFLQYHRDALAFKQTFGEEIDFSKNAIANTGILNYKGIVV